MNSEELELSLRSEFESYLKTVLAGMKQETAEFQSKIEAEFEKHRSQLDEAFRAFGTRFDSEHTFDDAFRGSVSEHLRLARDEGARITADAMAEAEKLGGTATTTTVIEAKYDSIRDAVNDISSKDSQSAILKSLVQHAADFAPRGAFFIIKNEHFVGWKVFGTDDETVENAVREIHFPTSADSILGAAVKTLSPAEGFAGAHSGDSVFLDPLHFGQPSSMNAIPLVARGRCVAVLYADQGDGGTSLNLEALETLTRVAGLTVELLAASQTAKAENRTVTADFEDAQHESTEFTPAQPEARFDDTIRETSFATPEPVVESEPANFAFSESVSYEGGFVQEPEPVRPVELETLSSDPFSQSDAFSSEAAFTEAPRFDEPTFEVNSSPAFAQPVETSFAPEPVTVQEPEVADTSGAMVFDSGGSIEPAGYGSPFDQAAEEYEPAAAVSSSGFSQAIEPVMETPVMAPPQARLSDRPVDLPIEVPDEERRIHNDARRFARLLVSEIKLYNEKKVVEGRQANDLYDRLREAIDRSREMYDKRVQPPVAAKFDYFHYELVNSLAEGNAQRLGQGYPGASV